MSSKITALFCGLQRAEIREATMRKKWEDEKIRRRKRKVRNDRSERVKRA